MPTYPDAWIETEALYPPIFWGVVLGASGLSIAFVATILVYMSPFFGPGFAVAYSGVFVGGVAILLAYFFRTERAQRIRVSRIGIERAGRLGPFRTIPAAEVWLEPRGSAGFGILRGLGRYNYVYLSPNQFAAASAAFPDRIQSGSSPARPLQ